MSIWDRFLYLIGLRQTSGPRTYHVDVSDSFQVTLATLASDEGRPEHELIPELLTAGLTQYVSNDRLFKKWESLSPREKDVAALVCLGHTNREIAARLNISPETVKDRIGTALQKFRLTKRTELRVLLANWDFSAWDRQEQPARFVSPHIQYPRLTPVCYPGGGCLFFGRDVNLPA